MQRTVVNSLSKTPAIHFLPWKTLLLGVKPLCSATYRFVFKWICCIVYRCTCHNIQGILGEYKSTLEWSICAIRAKNPSRMVKSTSCAASLTMMLLLKLTMMLELDCNLLLLLGIMWKSLLITRQLKRRIGTNVFIPSVLRPKCAWTTGCSTKCVRRLERW